MQGFVSTKIQYNNLFKVETVIHVAIWMSQDTVQAE